MKFTIYLLLVLLIVIAACGKKTHCPEFSEEEMTNIPYRVGDTIKFKDASNNSLNIPITAMEKSEAYSFKCKDLNNICDCERYVNIKAFRQSENMQYTLIRLEIYPKNNIQIYRYSIGKLDFEFNFEDDANNIHLIENMSYLGDLQIESKTYNDVYVVSNQDFTNTMISNVYFNKADGIIRILENGGRDWKLSE